MRGRYTATVARRRVSQVEYHPVFVLLVTPDGELVVVGVAISAAEAGIEQADVRRLLAFYVEPELVLDYLHDRNSTNTSFSKPAALIAESAADAARKLIAREEEPAPQPS